jgi:hypothetical protein
MSSEPTKRLWEVDHPYYCSESNFFARDCSSHYDRWQDFVEVSHDEDFDMNLIFRFDWIPPWINGDSNNPIEWQGDENYRDCTLKLFYIGQRKGLFRSVTIDVCRADEPKVRAFLLKRLMHLQKLWEPFT